MKIQEENKIIRSIYEEALLQEKKIFDVLSRIEDEELSDELNYLLMAWRQFGRKARKRLQENLSAEDGHQNPSIKMNSMDLRMTPDIDDYIIKSRPKDIDAGKGKSSDDAITREEIMRTEQMAERMKYMIHENKRAGIFATELAKELIDFEELSIKKLKNYLE